MTTTRSMMQLMVNGDKNLMIMMTRLKQNMTTTPMQKTMTIKQNKSSLSTFFYHKPSYPTNSKPSLHFQKTCLVFIANKPRDSCCWLRSLGHTTKSKEKKKEEQNKSVNFVSNNHPSSDEELICNSFIYLMRWLVSLIINCLLSGNCCSIKNCMCCSWAIFSWQLLWFSGVSEKICWEQCANRTQKSPMGAPQNTCIFGDYFYNFAPFIQPIRVLLARSRFHPFATAESGWFVWLNASDVIQSLFLFSSSWDPSLLSFFLFSRLYCYFISNLRCPVSPPVQDKLNRVSNRGRNDLRSVLLSTPFMNGKNGSKRGGFMKRWLCNTSAITADTSWGDILSGSSGACGSGIKRFERESESGSCL